MTDPYVTKRRWFVFWVFVSIATLVLCFGGPFFK